MPSLSSQFNTMSISSDLLYEQILNNSSTVLLLDCRPYNEYSNAHVHTAVNLAVPSLMLRRLKKGCSVNFSNMISTEEGKRRFAKRDLMDKIVIYDGSTDNLTNTALELIIQRFVSEGLDNIFYLKGNEEILLCIYSYRCWYSGVLCYAQQILSQLWLWLHAVRPSITHSDVPLVWTVRLLALKIINADWLSFSEAL